MSTTQQVHEELAGVEVRGVTRASFILRGALAAGAVYGTGAVAPFVGNAVASSQSDIDILNFALTLEYLEADFYGSAAKRAGLSGEAKALAAQFAAQEQAHVDELTQAIQAAGGTPAKKPSFAFGVRDQAGFLKLAYTLENTGVSAYNGAGPSLANPAYLAAAGSIVQVEARHAAAIALLTGRPVTPDGAFDVPFDQAQVLAVAQPLIK